MIAVEFRHISKKFGNFKANDDISLEIPQGKVCCIVGENGAGKSTLMKMLFGLYHPDVGEIFVRERKVKYHSPHDSIADGIGMVHQHFMLIDDFTVTENVILGNEPRKGMRLDLKEAERKLGALADKYDLGVDICSKVGDLSVGQQQKTEILKLLYRDSEILIFDEPTAVLSPSEVDSFFRMIEAFREAGKTLIVITHKLDEVERIADKVCVLRKGKLVHEAVRGIDGLDIGEIGRAIIGGVELSGLKQKKAFDSQGRIILSLYNVSLERKGKSCLRDLKLELLEHEIHGIAGVENNGQNELAEIVCGLEKEFSGDLLPPGVSASYVPDDRIKKGMISEFSIGENFLLKKEEFVFLDEAKLREDTLRIISSYDIRVPDASSKMGDLSGGNQQKAIIAREISENNKVMIFSHPTRGVDIGASVAIHSSIVEQRNKGAAVLLISSDIEELLLLSDRLSVIYKGRIVRTFGKAELQNLLPGKNISSELREEFLNELGSLMTGASA